jgi:predicted ribosome quality control (RQC) complex YloA/Tae2 family protein
MQITLSLQKSLEQNAAVYYEKAKKAKKKIEGAKEAIARAEQRLAKLEKELQKESRDKEGSAHLPARKKEWYEKFRWFYSSEGFLCIGGRDATTNEIVIKKHAEKDDIVFHTDMAGSPFFVVKSRGAKVGEATLKEAAQATGAYSKAWKLGLSTSDVFYVKPEQVSKEAQSGEYMSKGSFMIRGKTTYIRPDLKLAVGIKDNQIIGGAVDAIKAHAEKYVVVEQGNEKASDVAKKLKHNLGGELDEIIRFLPAGGCRII